MLSLRFKKSALAAAIIAPIALFASAAGAADAAAAPAPLKAGTYTVTTPGNNGMVEVTVELAENAIKSVKIGKNVRIGSDNIIGWGSIVTKSFESSNQLLVGSPAKVVKTGVRWDGRTIKEYMKGGGR